MTKDTVFDMVLRELPVDATQIGVAIEARYTSRGKQERSVTTGYFPSKSEASFRRNTEKANDSMKSLEKSVEDAIDMLKAFENVANKRLVKIERKLNAGEDNSVSDDESV